VTDQYHGGRGDFFDDQDNYRSSIYQAHVVEGERHGGCERELVDGGRHCRRARDFMETSLMDLQDGVQPVRYPSWEIQDELLGSQELIAAALQPWYQRASMQDAVVETTGDEQPGVAPTSEDDTESPRTITSITTSVRRVYDRFYTDSKPSLIIRLKAMTAR
jgi:hypothetical protein